MADNQTMDCYVQPQHIYSHRRTCTHSGSCRRPSSLVEFHVCYLLDRASVHEILALMTWFQCISNIFIHYRHLDPLYIFNYYRDIDLLYIFIHFIDFDILYVVCGDDHTCQILYIMPIHGHCTLMYLGLLYVFAVTCRYWSLYCTDEWLVLPPGSSLFHLWDGVYNVFRPWRYPTDLTH